MNRILWFSVIHQQESAIGTPMSPPSRTLLQAPALSLSTGSEFNLFVTERKGMALGVLTQLRGPHQ